MNEERILYKWVSKANMYCKTTFKTDKSGKVVQTQEWLTKEEYEELMK